MTNFSHLIEQRQSSQQVFRGTFLQVMSDVVKLPNGRETVREYILHPGAVMIIGLIGEGADTRVVLERQYRHPMGEVMIEFPAGKLDPREQSKACAKRELREETGYTAGAWARAGRLHPCISYATEFIDIWFARDLRLGERQLDEGEFLDVFTATPQELSQMCMLGDVTDSKTLAGMMWLQNLLSGVWQPDWEIEPE